MCNGIIPISDTQIAAAKKVYVELPQWCLADIALEKLCKNFPGFDQQSCLLKCVAIDTLYATNVYDIIPLAQKIANILAKQGETAKGNEIKLVNKLAKHPERNNHLISFASKFCHFYISKDRFYIYDEAARSAIEWHLGDEYRKHIGKMDKYPTFCENVLRLRTECRIKATHRGLDRYLWLTGNWIKWQRRRNPNKSPVNAEVTKLFKKPSSNLISMLPENLRPSVS